MMTSDEIEIRRVRGKVVSVLKLITSALNELPENMPAVRLHLADAQRMISSALARQSK